jgi:hypothetical protein
MTLTTLLGCEQGHFPSLGIGIGWQWVLYARPKKGGDTMNKKEWAILAIVMFVALLAAWIDPEDLAGIFPGMHGMFPNAERSTPGFKAAQR